MLSWRFHDEVSLVVLLVSASMNRDRDVSALLPGNGSKTGCQEGQRPR